MTSAIIVNTRSAYVSNIDFMFQILLNNLLEFPIN